MGPSQTAFPYRIEKKVGEGAMGIVYRAFDPSLSRPVAIKVLKPEVLASLPVERRSEAALRFLQEARAAAKLSHPGITTIYQIDQTGERPYIVMEWLEGRSLEDILETGPLVPDLVVRIGTELAQALEAAHGAGIVHRDIKPSNLILLESGPLKVTDFGIARVEGGDLIQTRAGEVLATPLYASPEQLRGQVVDGRSDIYSAGVVLYQLLSGQPPFRGNTLAELATEVLLVNPRPIRESQPGCPAALEAVILKALEKDPARRFQKASELAAALQAAITSPVTAASPVANTDSSRTESLAPISFPRPVDESSSSPVTTLAVTSMERGELLTAALAGWPERKLPHARVRETLTRLLEIPLHAEPFSGALRVAGQTVLLIHQGWIEAAFAEGSPGLAGEAITDRLPPVADLSILTPPPAQSAGIVPLLASLLQERKVRLSGLDSTLVNLPALARKLELERFSGLLSLKRGDGEGRILLVEGKAVLQYFSGEWSGLPVTDSWQTWIAQATVEFQVEEPVSAPLFESFRHRLRNFEVRVRKAEADSSQKKMTASSLFRTFKKTPAPGTMTLQPVGPEAGQPLRAEEPSFLVLRAAFERDPVQRFLSYLVEEMPGALVQRGVDQGLKYISTWIPQTAKALLHHDLPRSSERTSDFFDLVTLDEEGKVLLLAEWVQKATPQALQRFVERVIAAKSARIKTGDIGGAVLVARGFDDDTEAAYKALVTSDLDPARSWTFAAIESATQYEGFVRIGPRRGFHLMLVQETGKGFEILLP